MGSKFGNELGLHLPRGMASSSLPSSATTIASTATASSSMLPPRLSSNASSFSSVDTVLGGRNLGGHAAGGAFELPTREAMPPSSGGMRPPRESKSKRKASQLGGVDTASFSAVPVARKDAASEGSQSSDGGASSVPGRSLGGLGSGRLPMSGEASLLPLLKGGNPAKQAAPTPRAAPKALAPTAGGKQQQPQLQPPGGAGGGSTSYASRAECAADDPSMIEL